MEIKDLMNNARYYGEVLGEILIDTVKTLEDLENPNEPILVTARHKAENRADALYPVDTSDPNYKQKLVILERYRAAETAGVLWNVKFALFQGRPSNNLINKKGLERN